MGPSNISFWRDRLQASGIHLLLSLLIAGLAGVLVFGIWYPYPYSVISGGRELFLLVVSVDVILGPLITLSIFNRAKGWAVLRRDLAWVALLQLMALSYGLWTVCVARPVHLVFEYNRFTVVHAIDVPPELLPKAAAGLDTMPLWGPTLLSLRPFKNNQEKTNATLEALSGLSLGARPDLWQAYASARPEILQSARPISALNTRFPQSVRDIERAIASTGHPSEELVFVPMIGRKSFWTVLLDGRNAEPLAYLPLDAF